jgi:hypothetical protein
MTIEVYLLSAGGATIESRFIRRRHLLEEIRGLVEAREAVFVQTASGHLLIVDRDVSTEHLTSVATFDGLAIPTSRNIVIAGNAANEIVSPEVSIGGLAAMIEVIFPVLKPKRDRDESGAFQFDIITQISKPKVSVQAPVARRFR